MKKWQCWEQVYLSLIHILLSFIKTDNVYHKYYDDVLILLKTGLRISELCGLTVADIDFKNEVVIIDHQLLKSKEQGYYIETPKTKSGIRQVPLSRETIQAFQRVMKKHPKAEPFVIDGRDVYKRQIMISSLLNAGIPVPSFITSIASSKKAFGIFL